MVGWYLNDVIEALCGEGGEQLKNRGEIVHFGATPQFKEGSLENQSKGKREKVRNHRVTSIQSMSN